MNGIKNNWKGNGFLTGGTLIVKKGGQEVILCYKQQELADHLRAMADAGATHVQLVLDPITLESIETVGAALP